MARRKYSRSEKIFYIISVLIIISMVLGSIAFAIAPSL